MYDQLKLDNQVCFRLYTVSRLLTQAYRPLLEPLGLTYPQYLVLLVLWEKDHQLVSDITRRLMLESNTITPLLQRMERQGLVVRSKGIVDGRQTLVSLSKQGIQLREKAKDIPSCLSALWQGDPIDASEATHFVDTLDHMINTLKSNNE